MGGSTSKGFVDGWVFGGGGRGGADELDVLLLLPRTSIFPRNNPDLDLETHIFHFNCS